jgi:DNA replication and repair protein RecF
MRVTSLAVEDWRNLSRASLTSDARFVVLHGENAQGKTNMLEAVFMMASLRSFRESRPRRLIRHDAKLARIEVEVAGMSGKRKMRWSYGPDGRELLLDDGPVSRLQEWFAPLRAILFCPEHSGIVRGGPEERRQFIDRARFTAAPAYLDLVRAYQRVIRQKAMLLRGPARDAELDIWDQRLVELGIRMARQRQQMVDELRGPFQQMIKEIAGNEVVDLQLRGVGIPGVTQGSLAEIVARSRPEERRQKRVLAGPHRDDLAILLGGRLARSYASQGQARSIVLALKLAELLAARQRNDAPLFLLDDLTSELDARRMHRLVGVLSQMRSQVWITTTDPAHLGPLPPSECLLRHVVGGTVGDGSKTR